jgi:predicted AlkP superfamily phosphohydrolase/phosphomutase
LRAFWEDLEAAGLRVGTFDVPFAPFKPLTQGFQLSEWGAHDLLEGRLQVTPQPIAALVDELEAHPLLNDRLDTGGPHDYDGLKRLSSQCLAGVKLRGKLAQRLISKVNPHVAIIVFTELHHTGHYLWHTQAPDHAVYKSNGFHNFQPTEPTLQDLYREVDNQIAELIRMAGPEATVLVFSLHGMRPTHGVPSFLEPLLCERGFARLAGWTSQSWKERAIGTLAAAKRLAPTKMKKLYYKTLPPTTAIKLAQPTMLALYDWQNTRAFAVPADQHGWIRLNLIGRESRGVVKPTEYEELCQQVTLMLEGLTTDDGRRIVREVLRTAQTAEQALVQHLPDLVVHWEDAAFSAPLKIKDSSFVSEPVGKKFTGRHARDGFCVFRGASDLCEGDTLRARDIHRVIQSSIR